MTSSERPSPERLLKKGDVASRTEGDRTLASNALNYRVWGIPAVLRVMPKFQGVFRVFSGVLGSFRVSSG